MGLALPASQTLHLLHNYTSKSRMSKPRGDRDMPLCQFITLSKIIAPSSTFPLHSAFFTTPHSISSAYPSCLTALRRAQLAAFRACLHPQPALPQGFCSHTLASPFASSPLHCGLPPEIRKPKIDQCAHNYTSHVATQPHRLKGNAPSLIERITHLHLHSGWVHHPGIQPEHFRQSGV